MKKHGIPVLISLLFIVSAIGPLVIGFNIRQQLLSLNDDILLNIDSSKSPPVANFTIQNDSSIGIVTFDGSLSYDFDGEIISYEWDYGDGTFGHGMHGWHQYCDIGTYNVILTVTDNDGLKGNITRSVYILLANIPTPIIEINGPTSGKIGIVYDYTYYIWYTDDAFVYLYIDWGDGNTTGWIGPYFTHDLMALNHSWFEKGIYNISARAKDFCRIGEWTYLEVTIPKSQNVYLGWVERFPLVQKILDGLRLNSK